jgi:5-hydroxyisourate hydrolase-like protein (transthyretin family)
VLQTLTRQVAALIVSGALTGLIACKRTEHYPLGKLAARVIDTEGRPVRGVAADLFKLTPSGKVYWRATRTDSAGIAVFGAKDGGVIEGNYQIHVSFINWMVLAPGEVNDKPVTLKEGGDTVVTFRARARLPLRH